MSYFLYTRSEQRRSRKLMAALRSSLKPENEIVVYSTGRVFKTEGDMHEYLTGHRSKIIDAAELKRRRHR